jgi:hypothetical protein
VHRERCLKSGTPSCSSLKVGDEGLGIPSVSEHKYSLILRRGSLQGLETALLKGSAVVPRDREVSQYFYSSE